MTQQEAIQKAIEALKFYADHETYAWKARDIGYPYVETGVLALDEDRGHRAREALTALQSAKLPEWMTITNETWTNEWRLYRTIVKSMFDENWHYEVYQLYMNENGDLINTDGDIFSAWSPEDFIDYQNLPAPPNGGGWMSKTVKPCRYYKQYKGIFKPKCNCRPCWLFWKTCEEHRNIK